MFFEDFFAYINDISQEIIILWPVDNGDIAGVGTGKEIISVYNFPIVPQVQTVAAGVLAVVYSIMFVGAALGGLQDADWEIDWETEDTEWDAEEEIPWIDLNPEPVDDSDMSDGPGFAEGEATATSPASLGTPMRTIGMRDWEYQVVLGPSMLDANALVSQLDAGDLSSGMWVVIQPFWSVDYYFTAQ